MDPLKAYLVKHFGLAADADEAAVKKLAAEKLTQSQILEIVAPKANEPSALDKLLALIEAKQAAVAPAAAPAVVTAQAPSAESVNAAAAAAIKAHGIGAPKPDSAVQPAEMFAGAAKEGTVNVKRASANYDSTKQRLVYPSANVPGKAPHPKAGQDVTYQGSAMYKSSDLERAQFGAWMKWQVQRETRGLVRMSDHESDLFRELVESEKWVGDADFGSGPEYIGEGKQLNDFQKKTLLSDSTSGGEYLVPYFYDLDLVTYPLLNGELFPFVDLHDLTTSDTVETPTLDNMSLAWGPAEGDSPVIALQTTTSLAAWISSKVFAVTGAITIGRDFLTDSPIKLYDKITAEYQKRLLNVLDSGIAAGDGSTAILGIFNTSSTHTYTAANNTAGPVKMADVTGMIEALPKEYRPKNTTVLWLSLDSLYWKIKEVQVNSSTGDQRLVLGYDPENYTLLGRPYKITNSADVAGSQLAFFRPDLYRMWRRKGAQFEMTDAGKTLRLANELLITMRSRWAGQIVDPGGVVLGSGFSLNA